MWSLYVNYSSSAVIHMQCGRHIIFSRGHVSIMWNVCIQVLGVTLFMHWIHMRYIYWHICLMCVHELIAICSISVAFEGNICWHIYDYSMENKVAVWFFVLFWLVCPVMQGLHVDYIIRSHDQKVLLYLISIIVDLWNAVIPLMTPSSSYETDANTNGVNDQKSHVTSHFSCQPKICIGAIDNTISITWLQGWCQWCNMTKK